MMWPWPPAAIYAAYKHSQEAQQRAQNEWRLKLLIDADVESAADVVCEAISVCGAGYVCKDAWISDKKITASPSITRGWLSDHKADLCVRLNRLSPRHTRAEFSLLPRTLESEYLEGVRNFANGLTSSLRTAFASRNITTEVAT